MDDLMLKTPPNTLIVIPARWASERFPGKPLALLKGASGQSRTLIARTVDAGLAVGAAAQLVVATDDIRIAEEARAAGANAVMTDPDARNGTERVADAVARLDMAPDIVINLQGDAPLTPPWYIEALIETMADPSVDVATPVLEAAPDHLDRLRADRQAGRVGATTAVCGAGGRALYFSKEVLPFGGGARTPVLHHVGVYAYRPAALKAYLSLTPGDAELAEGLEQLRFLEHGTPITCTKVEARGRAFWEVNTPEDIARVEAILMTEGRD
ncbi:MAG: manno-octulosonate cytidylyltransferase [Pseudomonadota bacterium]